MKKSGSVKTDDTVVMDRAAMREVLDRIAAAIVENHKDDDMMALVGIRTGGIHIARRLVANIQEHLGREVPLGTLDINLYRD
ncbi:MAG TPA: bifunctional pyr operon transcriptional regulator/uracil phosphoribosyltransferase, partial [Nitrospirales bacterium]|nr:bifunctional pyr operon transcriptional regulator/uracil phosphoribosyltransferase [Nitrospirales bacterium]